VEIVFRTSPRELLAKLEQLEARMMFGNKPKSPADSTDKSKSSTSSAKYSHTKNHVRLSRMQRLLYLWGIEEFLGNKYVMISFFCAIH
jgi:hypothetical protein